MRQQFEAFFTKLKAHDIEGALSHLADDFSLQFGDSGFSLDRKAYADALGWDKGTGGERTHGDLSAEGRTISGLFTETNEFLRLLGIPELKARNTFTFNEEGKITRQHYEMLPGQPSFLDRMKPAVEWGRENRSEVLEEIYPEGQLLFNEKNAREWVRLLRAWKADSS